MPTIHRRSIPIGDLYKTQVWALARHLGVPDVIVNKPATADLIVGQTDEADLGISYARADEILNGLLHGFTHEALRARGFTRDELATGRAPARLDALEAAAAGDGAGESQRHRRVVPAPGRLLNSPGVLEEFALYLQLGFHHIADLAGYDHLLFVTALAIPYAPRDWRRLAILVTAFTLGHSITLALATLRLVAVPTAAVEALIPATILVTAVLSWREISADASGHACRRRDTCWRPASG